MAKVQEEAARQRAVTRVLNTVITPEVLVENGVTHNKELVKILAKGELTAKMEVRAHAFSAKAKEMIEAVGGTCEKYETK